MVKGRSSSLINQVSLLAFLALCVITALGWLDIKDRSKISKTLEAQEQLLSFKQCLSKVERQLLSARIHEISMIETRQYASFQSFQESIGNAQALSTQLIEEVGQYSGFSKEFANDLRIILTEDLSDYKRSVQASAVIEMRIGLSKNQGLLDEIKAVRSDIIRLITPLNQDTLLLTFLNIQLSEQEFAETLDMRISDRLVADIASFKAQIEGASLASARAAELTEALDNYHNLVKQLLESILELELATAENTLYFDRITPALEESQDQIDTALSLIEQTLVQQRQTSTIVMALFFVVAFLIVLIFTITQIRHNQRLVRRLQKLANHMGKIALGQYPRPEDLPQGKDEIGVLSEAFLTMTAQIHAQIDTIKQEQKNAEVANNAKSVFLANMSHELRTPLNAILGFAQVMQHSPATDSECQHYLNIINDSGEHLLSLINDVLEISKIESGKFALAVASVDLDQLLAHCQQLFQNRATQKQLAFAVTRSPHVPRFIRTDKAKLRQILINLLGNAIKFTAAGEVTLTVQLESVSAKSLSHKVSESDRSSAPKPIALPPDNSSDRHGPSEQSFFAKLLFVVEDTGPGVPAHEQHHIFEAFTQTTAGQQSQEGSGLGLAISRQYARLMGGDLTVANAPSQGAIFTLAIEVECIANAPPTELKPLSSGSGTIQTLVPDQQWRILVAEDHKGNRLLMQKLLSTVGFDIKDASNGQEAIELWQSWQPDLILMDIQMPVMDGFEAVRYIRQHSHLQQPKIVALTASAFEEQRQAILDVGCDDFASKPVNRERLLTLIGHQLGVQYVYKQPTPSPLPTYGIQPSALYSLNAMSAYWVKQLYKASIRGDDRDVHDLIQQIPPDHHELIATLTAWANNYRFDLLMEIAEPVMS